VRCDYRCRTCGEPVTVTGTATSVPVSMRLALHTATDTEAGPDGHLVAPIEADLLEAAVAREAGER
jgi:hypothetical protein